MMMDQISLMFPFTLAKNILTTSIEFIRGLPWITENRAANTHATDRSYTLTLHMPFLKLTFCRHFLQCSFFLKFEAQRVRRRAALF